MKELFKVELVYPTLETADYELFTDVNAAQQFYNQQRDEVIDDGNTDGYDYIVINQITDDHDYVDSRYDLPMYTF